MCQTREFLLTYKMYLKLVKIWVGSPMPNETEEHRNKNLYYLELSSVGQFARQLKTAKLVLPFPVSQVKEHHQRGSIPYA